MNRLKAYLDGDEYWRLGCDSRKVLGYQGLVRTIPPYVFALVVIPSQSDIGGKLFAEEICLLLLIHLPLLLQLAKS